MASDAEQFSVRCTCGEVIHTSDAHIGRTIRCRCGQPVVIARPAPQRPAAASDLLFSAKSSAKSSARPKRARTESNPTPAASTSRERRRGSSSALTRGAGVARRLAGRPLHAFVNDLTSPRALTRWSSIASVVMLVGTLATWLLLAQASEEFIPATLLAYGPRFVVLIPLALGALVSLGFARASLVLYVVSGAIALGPIMGMRLHLLTGRGPVPSAAPTHVRVMSVNAQGGEVAAQYLPGVIRDLRADVVDVQECGDRLAAILAAQPGMHTARYANLCLLSRWPLSAPDSMPRAAFARVSELGYGGTALVVRFRVANPARAFDFVMLHLETPRKGIEKLMGGADGFIPDGGGVPTLGDVEGERINARIRRMESERASVWASRFVDSVPVIVAGDFNMPVESSIFRQFWTRFDDAFEAAGLGFGYTKTENRYIHARIDHVLYAPTWFRASGAWVGPEVGSDHRPVIADLAPLR